MQRIYTVLAEYNYDGSRVYAFTSYKKAISKIHDLVESHLDLLYQDLENFDFDGELKHTMNKIKVESKEELKLNGSYDWSLECEDMGYYLMLNLEVHQGDE